MPAKKPRNLYPHVDKHDPDPAKLRALLAQASLSARAAALRLGIDPRTMQRYVSDDALQAGTLAPYVVQFALERLAAQRAHLRSRTRRPKLPVPHS